MHNHQPVDQLVKSGTLRRRADASADVDPTHEQHPLLKLQRQLGNATVARMLAQREGMPEDEIAAKHDTALAQREGLPEDEIAAKHDPSLAQREGLPEDEIAAKHDPSLAQREGMPEDEIAAKHDPALAQRSDGDGSAPEVGLEGGPISDALAGRIQSKRGSGSALDGSTQSTMEGAFGTRFDDVRVHHDDESDALNRSISAKAFTTGSDIFFSRSASPSDSQLVAHELTHVVQQRSMSHLGPMSVGPAGDSHEQAADSVAASMNSGATASAQRALEDVVAPAAIARDADAQEEEMV